MKLLLADEFFTAARERYNIKLRRDAGQPWPWTSDKVFQEWRFTNIFREDDKTTTWFRENIRKPLVATAIDNPRPENWNKIVESTLIFRAFNRITTGQCIADLLLHKWDSEEARERLTGVKPLVTGAFMLKYESGMDKLSGVLSFIDEAIPQLPAMVPKWGKTLEGAWADLKEIRYLGGFTAHEIVQDLRYTPILDHATDIMTWGHLGPGATRGINFVANGSEFIPVGGQKMMLAAMAQLLEMSKDNMYWPSIWPAWEMHQVEFFLCEFSKYCKAKSGIGQKRRYQQ